MLRSAFLPAHRKLSPMTETQHDPTASDTKSSRCPSAPTNSAVFLLGRCLI